MIFIFEQLKMAQLNAAQTLKFTGFLEIYSLLTSDCLL